jgi:hypothetical protein
MLYTFDMQLWDTIYFFNLSVVQQNIRILFGEISLISSYISQDGNDSE